MAMSNSSLAAGKKRKRSTKVVGATKSLEDDISVLETKATESPKHYNNIATLLALACPPHAKSQPNKDAIVALCRIFTRLFAGGQFRNHGSLSEGEQLVQNWLEERYAEFVDFLLRALRHQTHIMPDEALTYLMKLAQSEICCQGHHMWTDGVFYQVLGIVLRFQDPNENSMDHFVNEYFTKYDDVKLNTLQILVYV